MLIGLVIGAAIGGVIGFHVGIDYIRERIDGAWTRKADADLAETRYQLSLAGLAVNPNIPTT